MTHTAFINLWPSLAEFAGDISVSYGTAKAMRRRGSVPPAYWSMMVKKAKERRIAGVDEKTLALAIAHRSPSEKEDAA